MNRMEAPFQRYHNTFVPYFLDILGENTEEDISAVQLHLLEEKDPRVKTSILIYLDFQTEYAPSNEQMLRILANTEWS